MGYNSLFTIINAFYPILILPHLTSTLDTEAYGSVLYLEVIAKYFCTFSLLGLPIYGVKEIATRKDSIDINSSFFELLIVNLFFTILSLIAVVVFSILALELNLLQLSCMLVLLFSSSLNLEWVLQGFEEFKFIAIRGFIVRVCTLAFIFTLIKDPFDSDKLLILLSGSSLIIMILNWQYLFRHKLMLSKINFGIFRESIKNHIKPLFTLFLTIAAISIYTLFDTIFLGFYSSNNEVAFYSVGQKIPKAASMLLASIITVIYPQQAKFANSDDSNYSKLLSLSLHITILFGGIVVIGMIVFGDLFLDFIIPASGYDKSKTILKIMSSVPLIIGLSNFFGIQVISTKGKNKMLLYFILSGAIISLILNLFLVPTPNSIGSAIANVATEFIITFIMAFYVIKYLDVSIQWSKISRLTIKMIALLLFLLLIKMITTGFQQFVQTIVLFILTILGVFIFFRKNFNKLLKYEI